MTSLVPAGDFRTTYAADTTIFPTVASRKCAIAGIGVLCLAPFVLSQYWLSILIQIGYFAIAAPNAFWLLTTAFALLLLSTIFRGL